MSDEGAGSQGKRPDVQIASNAKRRGQKSAYRVQFLGDSADHSPADIPHIQLPDDDQSQDGPLASPVWQHITDTAAQSAQNRARKLQSRLSISAPASPSYIDPRHEDQDYFNLNKQPKDERSYRSPPLRPLADHPVRLDDIPLANLRVTRPYDINDESTDEDIDDDEDEKSFGLSASDNEHSLEARRLIRSFTNGMPLVRQQRKARSGTATPAADRRLHGRSHEVEYVPAPDQYKPSVLSSILFSKLANYDQSERKSSSSSVSSTVPPRQELKKPPRAHGFGSQSPESSGYHSGRTTPGGRKPKWYDKSASHSISSSTTLNILESSGARSPSAKTVSRPPSISQRSSGMIAHAVNLIKQPGSRSKPSQSSEIQDHIVQLELQVSDILARRKYLLKLCKALMVFGAPTHRMEEYMTTSARKLQVQGSFQYLPNCMIVAFDDPDTHTTEVHLVKETTAIDLGKFKDVFNVYKNVIHEKYHAMEAAEELVDIIERPKAFPVWLLVIVYGVAAVSVGPFAFSARPVDFPICFMLGCVLGWLQLVVAPNSTQFSHVFEVAASVVISFTARGFGSIMRDGKPLFCFSAITQSSIALILPGWIILCAAQELQSRNLVAGSIRMVYAIIYTLFLGFGILIGTTLMGLVYPSATDSVTCDIPWWWNGKTPLWRTTYVNFVWVPIFTICLAMVNQARWSQMLPMTIISLAGYTTNYFASMRFAQNIQVANACGAFVIGSMANLYSRFFHGLAAATMLPAIFVQVPSGLAAGGSLVAGLTSANQITRNATGISVVNNGTQGFLDAQDAQTSDPQTLYGGTIFNVGYGMVQVAIGISVGLFLSALFIYPFNKRRSGLFSF